MAVLIFEDGARFSAPTCNQGASGVAVVYTGTAGQQQALCDSTTSGKIVVFAYPHVGVCGADSKQNNIHANGAICQAAGDSLESSLCDIPLTQLLEQNGIGLLNGADTRAIVQHIRLHGQMRCAFAHSEAEAKALLEGEITFRGERNQLSSNGDSAITVVNMGLRQQDISYIAERFGSVRYIEPSEQLRFMEFEDLGAIIMGGGLRGDVVHAQDLAKRLLASDIPFYAFGSAHQAMATAAGYDIGDGKTFFGPSSPVRNTQTGKLYTVERGDLFSVTGSGEGALCFEDVIDSGICGLSFGKGRLSTAFCPSNTNDILDEFIATVRGEA